MNIESPRYGAIEVAPDKVIEFPRGMPGFDELRNFTLLHPEGEDPKYFVLQSLDLPEVAFNLTDPARFGFNFEISLSDDDAAALELAAPEEAAVVVMLVRDGEGHLRANLNAPLVLNLRSRRGIQHVFSRLNYEVTVRGE